MFSHLVRVIKSLKWQEKFEEFAENFSKLKEDLRTRMVVVIHITTLDTHSVATSTETKVDDMGIKLHEIQALLRGRTAFEKEIARFLEKHGGAARTLRDDVALSRLVKKIEGVDDERDYRTVHFEPREYPRRRNSGRSNSYNSETDGPYGSAAASSWAEGSRRAPSAYSPYSPRAPSSSQLQQSSASGYVVRHLCL